MEIIQQRSPARENAARAGNTVTNGSRGSKRLQAENAVLGSWQHLQQTVGNRMVMQLLRDRGGISAAPPLTVQRAPGLPTKTSLRDEGLKAGSKAFGKSSWSQLEEALDGYEKLADTDYEAQGKQMMLIEGILGKWKESYDGRKKKKKQDEAKLLKINEIRLSIETRRRTILEAQSAPSASGEGRARRGEAVYGGASPIPRMETSATPKLEAEKNATVTMKEFLLSSAYKADRNYASWSPNEDGLEHVSWKAHVGSGDAAQRLAIAQKVGPLLVGMGVSHKFDTTVTEEPIDKFLTVYPPKDEKDWAVIVAQLESTVSGFATVDVVGDMPVGDSGQVHMRHGQNTPLFLGMLKGLDVKQEGIVGAYPQIVGSVVDGGGLPLLMYGGKLFFSKTMGAPDGLSPEFIYMAILFNGKIVPDKREEPNPANAPMPPGVSKFEKK